MIKIGVNDADGKGEEKGGGDGEATLDGDGNDDKTQINDNFVAFETS